jgi:hypothetical protein
MVAALRRLLYHMLSPAFFIMGCVVLAATALASPAAVTHPAATMRNNPLVQQAINDLARRQSIAPASIELLSFEEVVWPDTSLGCPRPDMRYRQVLQDGAKILLRFSGGERVYHSGGSRPPFWCSTSKSGQGLGPPIKIEFEGTDGVSDMR